MNKMGSFVLTSGIFVSMILLAVQGINCVRQTTGISQGSKRIHISNIHLQQEHFPSHKTTYISTMQHGYGYAYRYRKDTDTRIQQFPQKPDTQIRFTITPVLHYAQSASCNLVA